MPGPTHSGSHGANDITAKTAPKAKANPTEAAAAKTVAAQVAATEAALARATYRRMVETVERDGRYPLDAYRFLQEGLEYTVRRVHGAAAMDRANNDPPTDRDAPDPRHVGGVDLCLGLRDLAMARWGRLAKLVLNGWGVFDTRDFGEMVFVMVDNGFLQKTDADRIDDFGGVFPLGEFEADYRVPAEVLDLSDLARDGVAS